MNNKILVAVKRPNETAFLTRIDNTLEELQRIVGGYIETTTFGDVVVICNEEGLIYGLPYNCDFCGIDFCGTIIFCGEDEDEFTDLPLVAEPVPGRKA